MINLIEKTQDLIEFCKILEKQEFITIDTEFLREKTYYPEVCLIQVGCLETAAIIDSKAPDLDLSSFYRLLTLPQIVKVFHAGRQDIEIFYHLASIIPTPLFDTQIAAAACGFGESASYETLVNKITKREIDKTCRYTNWGIRPLDKKQLEYAIGDVTHLVDIYQYLKDYLEKNNRSDWIKEEIAFLQNPEIYQAKPENSWLKIKHHSHNGLFLTLLKELAAWREKYAQTHNLPKQSILRDDCLQSIAASCPDTVEKLKKIRNIRKDIPQGRMGEEILKVILQVKSLPKEDYISEKNSNSSNLNKNILLQEMLRLLLKIESQQHDVTAHLIATEDEIKNFAAGCDDVAFTSGWRKEIFGADALKLRNGEISLSYDPQHHKVLLNSTAN